MSDEVFLEGKSYVSAKRASELSGYARDYIGQLARGGLISAQRVGGLWYVSLDSLTAYQKNADALTPAQPQKPPQQDLDSIVSFDGKDYISASRAAKLTSYNQDYIGQLARAGKILSRQIGNRWYVERSGLLAHKAQKDSQLATVQAEAVGLARREDRVDASQTSYTSLYAKEPLLNYIQESGDLMPVLNKISPTEATTKGPQKEMRNPIPVHVVRMPRKVERRRRSGRVFHRGVRLHGNTMIQAVKAGAVLTFVIVLSYGLVTLKDSSLYATNVVEGEQAWNRSALTANAMGALDWFLSGIEKLVSEEIDYVRTP